jgi:hypothetical protein
MVVARTATPLTVTNGVPSIDRAARLKLNAPRYSLDSCSS